MSKRDLMKWAERGNSQAGKRQLNVDEYRELARIARGTDPNGLYLALTAAFGAGVAVGIQNTKDAQKRQ